MSYTWDIYRGRAHRCQLRRLRLLRVDVPAAGGRAHHPLLGSGGPTAVAHAHPDEVRPRRGVLLLGLAKKVLLANPCGKIADLAFDAGSLPPLDAWYGVTAYAFQIYFDFSGYSDMAIGLGLMLGFVFPKNFDSPYRAQSITEFWHRWHISLSTWLRDYLYVPLGGNRKGPAAHLREPVHRDAARRAVARRGVEFRGWGGLQTWDWSRTITAPKAVAVGAAFVMAAVMLTTQAFNPFIYFIF
jgi:hypothetical protein